MENDERHYYRSRERFNELLATGKGKTAEAAGLFYYLNRTGYNGLCRFNSKGGFNVPFGSYKTINYRTDFSEYPEAFRGWMFTCMDFEQLELERVRLRLRGSAVRRRVHAVLEGRLRLGRAGAGRGVAVEAQRAGDPLEPGDAAHREAVSRR